MATVHHCCVPGCKSFYNKSAKIKYHLSFHEFPARSPAREYWIEAVRNQFEVSDENSRTWLPHEATKICSLHFSPDQFKACLKRACLKPNSVPHIFLDYYMSKSENLKNEGDILPLKLNINGKFSENSKLEYNKVPTVVNCNVQSHSNSKVTLQALSSSLQNINDSSYVSDLVVDSSSCSSGMFENSSASLNSGISENQNISSHFDAKMFDQNLSKELSVNPDLSFNQDNHTSSDLWAIKELILETRGTQTAVNFSVMHQSGLKRKHMDEDDDRMKKDKHRHTVSQLKAQIVNLQQHTDNLALLNRRHNESLKLFNIKELEKGIANLDARALFLFEQLNSFNKKKTVWSENTVKVIDTLEEKFPQAYEYLKQSDIISLPPPKNVRLERSSTKLFVKLK